MSAGGRGTGQKRLREKWCLPTWGGEPTVSGEGLGKHLVPKKYHFEVRRSGGYTPSSATNQLGTMRQVSDLCSQAAHLEDGSHDSSALSAERVAKSPRGVSHLKQKTLGRSLGVGECWGKCQLTSGSKQRKKKNKKRSEKGEVGGVGCVS